MDAKQVLENFRRDDPEVSLASETERGLIELSVALVDGLRAALRECTTGQRVSRAYRTQQVLEEVLAQHAPDMDVEVVADDDPLTCWWCKERIRDLHFITDRPERWCSQQCMSDYLSAEHEKAKEEMSDDEGGF